MASSPPLADSDTCDASAFPSVGVIIPAGGIGSRLGHALPKQFLPLAGLPLLVRSCQAFFELPCVQIVAVAAPEAHYQQTQQLLQEHLSEQDYARLRLTVGGVTRQDSVAAGLQVLPRGINLVLVHDAARPLVERDLILRCLQAAMEHGAAIAAVPVQDTLKRADSVETEEARIVDTVEREGLWRAQTPQVARKDLLEKAFAWAHAQGDQGFVGTDEASLLEGAGITVHLVMGSDLNIKITRPEDLRLAAALLEERTEMSPSPSMSRIRIGHGFDAHRLVEGRPLILGGVTIPFIQGLDGHSDADVLAHALTDALLGALGEGDLGRHFPDSDPRYKGANSLLLLEAARGLADAHGLRLGNADLTIICQRPKLAPYLSAMQLNLARSCRVEPARINIKATTTEQMGYTGRGEGIAAHAVVLLKATHHDST